MFAIGGAAAADGVATVMPSVTVTANRSDLGATLQPFSASTVTAEQILATPAQSLDDVLRTVVGLNLPDYSSWAQHPTANLVSMRGLGGYARALVLRDGVPLNDPFFGYVQWNRVPMETVARVDVIRGAFASTWGNYAMGGVVNLISRQPTGTEATADAGYGNLGTSRVNANGSWAMADGFRLDANASDWRTDGYNEVPVDLRAPLDVPTSFKAQSAELTANGRFDSSLGGFLRVNYQQENQGLGTPLSSNWQRNIDYSGAVRKRFADDSSIALTGYYTDEVLWTANNGTPEGYARGFAEYIQNIHTTPVTDTGASLVWSKRYGSAVPLVSAGVDYHVIRGQDTAQIFDETGTTIRTDVGGGKQRFTGVFVQGEFVPLDRMQLTAGVRYEYWLNYDGFDGNPGGPGRTPDQSASSTNPRVAVRYALDDRWAVRGAAYKAFRAPNLNDLYRGYSIPGGIFLPNASLTPERLTGGEAGVDFDYGVIRGQVTAYSNTIKNLLTFRNLGEDELPPGFFFGTVNINAGKARTNGVEGEVNWNMARDWSALFTYAYNDPKILENPADPTTVGNTEGGIPLNTASATVTYNPGERWKAFARFRYVQGYYTDNAATLPIDSYAVVDLSASYDIDKRISVFAQIGNLFNRTYIAQNSGNATPTLGTPFTFFAGVRVALN